MSRNQFVVLDIAGWPGRDMFHFDLNVCFFKKKIFFLLSMPDIGQLGVYILEIFFLETVLQVIAPSYNRYAFLFWNKFRHYEWEIKWLTNLEVFLI